MFIINAEKTPMTAKGIATERIGFTSFISNFPYD